MILPSQRRKAQHFFDSWHDSFELFAAEALRINVTDARKQALGITDKIVPLRLNPAQKLIHEPLLIDDCKRILVLKSRQVGSSTFCVMWFLWRCLFYSGTRIAIAAQGGRSAKTILKMAAFALKNLPAWFRNHPAMRVRIGKISIDFANGSSIEAGTANSEFWSGSSLDGVLLTEASKYDDLQETMNTILPACTGPVFMESTAKGLGLFKDIWEDPNAGWRKVFISWLIDPYCRKATTDREPTIEDQSYINEHKLTPEQRNWYLETKWTTYAGNQKAFDQENPATPELAFIVAGSKFFYGRNFQFDPKDMPVGRRDWEAPQKGHKYVCGVDVAQGGLDGDASTAVILDVTDLKDVKVASVLQCWMPTPLFANDVIQMCREYGRVLACVESNVGLDVIRELRRSGVKQYVRQRDTKMTEQQDEYGFCTLAQTRPLLMANLTRYVMGNVIRDLADPRIKDECNQFVYAKTGKPEAASGKRDDLVLGLALAIEAIKQLHLLDVAPTPERIPPRPSHDINAAIQWDMKYGIAPKARASY